MCMLRWGGLRFLWITALVIFADAVTKALALHCLDLYSAVSVFPFFNLTLAFNTGMAFSLFDNGMHGTNMVLGSIVAGMIVAIVLWLYRLPREERLMGVGLSFILGGAIGNGIDRIFYSHVIDFMDIYISNWHWPDFNLADSAVCVGAFLIMWRWIK